MDNEQAKSNKFANERHAFYMIKTSKETIIHDNQKERYNYHYDRNTKIYRYDERHLEFLEAISLIINDFEKLENSLQEYYKFAFSADYNFEIAKECLKNIKISFEKIHIFLRSQDLALLHIKQALYEYFCEMTTCRFIDYLKYHDNDNLMLSQSLLNTFYEQDKNYLNNLFSPLLHLYNELYWGEKQSNINDSLSQIRENFLNDNTLNTRILELVQNGKTLAEIPKSKIKKTDKRGYILSRFQIIADVFNDYFLLFTNIQEYYPEISVFHLYALILSNNYLYSQIINECNFYSTHQSMYKIIENHLSKTANPLRIAIESNYIEAQTGNIYQEIKDSINSKETDNKETVDKWLKYYPERFEENMNAEIIEFQCFEQLIAIELLDIIAQNKTIKQCPFCDHYFITSSKKQEFCDQHKNDPTIRQKVHNKNKGPLSKIYDREYNRIYQKIRRAEGDTKKNLQSKFEKWSREAEELIPNESTEISQKEFIKKLEDLCTKYDIPRRYEHVKHKK